MSNPTPPDVPSDVLIRALHAADNMVVLADARLDDCPLVWVNDYFCAFTGYGRDEVLGRNCRFLQRDDRAQPGRRALRRAVEGNHTIDVVLRNYKKDGSLFYNNLFVSPVGGDDGAPDYFVGVQNDVTARVQSQQDAVEHERGVHAELDAERSEIGVRLARGVGRELSGVALLTQALATRLQQVGSVEADAAAELLDLVEQAGRSVRETAYELGPVETTPGGLAGALRRFGSSVRVAHPALDVEVEADPVTLDDARAARHLFRLAQEAVSGAIGRPGVGRVTVALRVAPAEVRLTVRDDGESLAARQPLVDPAGPADPSEVAYHAERAGGRLTVMPGDEGGTVVQCVVPRRGGS